MKKAIIFFVSLIIFSACSGNGDNNSANTDSLSVKTTDSAAKMQDTLNKMIDSAKVEIKVSADTSLQKK